MTTTADLAALPSYVLTEALIAWDAKGRARIPFCQGTGRAWVTRLVDAGGHVRWEPDDGRVLLPFGVEALHDPPHDRALVVVAGEADALALRAAQTDFDVLGSPSGCMWRRCWKRYLNGYRDLYVVSAGYDGRQIAQVVAVNFPHVVTIQLPDGVDNVRALLRDGGLEAFDALMVDARTEAVDRAA